MSEPAKIVAIGASAGGLQAIQTILSGLRADFPAPILLVVHIPPDRRSYLGEILSRHTRLKFHDVEEGAELMPGTVYCAMPDHHLIVNKDGTMSNTVSKPVRFSRPSVDVLFKSVAEAVGEGAIAVVLSGSLRDGSAGAEAVQKAGGKVIVQNPITAEFPSMPEAAAPFANGILDLSEIPAALLQFAGN